MLRREFLTAAGMAACSGIAPAGESSPPRAPWLSRPVPDGRNQNRSDVICQHGIVCASQPLAAQAGIDILKAGGNCIDAAIATNAVLGVTEAASNGIGGDLFAILWIEKEQRLYGLNASGRAPYGWNLAKAQALGLKSIPRVSPLSWNVPGCVSGWALMLERFGTVPLGRCLEAAIDYAQHGFPLSPIISTYYQFGGDAHPSCAAVYHPDGRVPRMGDVVKNPELAASLQRIATGGAAAFYEGEIAQKIVATSQELGGMMSLKDLQDHRANWVDPVSTNYRGFDVWEIPPNGQGICVLQMLNILEHFDIRACVPNSAEHIHLFVEAKKLAFEDRAHYYADMDLAQVPLSGLLSKDYARERAALIDPKKANHDFKYGDPKLDSDTVYLTVADGAGNMISLIQSLYHGYGSTICPKGLGFPIQNRGQSFSLNPTHRNRLESHKRPFHTIIPAFVTQQGKPVLSFGVMGGDFQPQGHCQVLMSMLDFQLTPQAAGEMPRAAHSGSSEPWSETRDSTGGSISLELGFSTATAEKLEALGHQVAIQDVAHGGYQAIWREDAPLRYFGGSDPRKDGMALGY